MEFLLNGCETWPLRVGDQRHLEVFYNDCMRRIRGGRRLDSVPYAVIRRQLHLRALPPVLFSVSFIGSGMLRDIPPVISSTRLSTSSPRAFA